MQGCKTSEKVPATIMGQPFPFDTEISASTRFDCVLSNDDCIQCCSSEELVTRNEELDAVVSKYDALPDAADLKIPSKTKGKTEEISILSYYPHQTER